MHKIVHRAAVPLSHGPHPPVMVGGGAEYTGLQKKSQEKWNACGTSNMRRKGIENSCPAGAYLSLEGKGGPLREQGIKLPTSFSLSTSQKFDHLHGIRNCAFNVH